MKASLVLLLLFWASQLWAHPADLNGDNRLTASELATYAGSSPDTSLLQQALNILTSGQAGAYESLQINRTEVFIPVSPNRTFAALGTYHAPPLTQIPVANLPAEATS